MADARVLLFGSGAKGTVPKDSGYDLLIVTEQTVTPNEKTDDGSKIRKALVWSLEVPLDVLLKDKREMKHYRHAKGHVIYDALNEAPLRYKSN